MQSGAITAPDFLYMRKYLYLIICSLFLCSFTGTHKRNTPKNDFRDSVMARIFAYSSHIDTSGIYKNPSYSYTKFHLRTNHRNATLMLVPTMYAIAKGAGRQFMGEYYNKLSYDNNPKSRRLQYHRLLNVSTIPHRRNPMSSVFNYLTPNVYDETIFQGDILSPYHKSNRNYYVYHVTPLPFGKAQVNAYPRFKNTQMVHSMAIVDAETGRIQIADIEGEYDMIRFYINLLMDDGGYKSLFPRKCDLKANFKFMGNQITAMYTSVYNLPKILEDTLNNVEDTMLMAKVRPIPLNAEEESIIHNYITQKTRRDSLVQAGQKKTNFAKDVLWDIIGVNVLNRIKQNFGKQDQGYVRMNPILNPLYMGYSHRKGFVYKFDVRGSYAFNDNIQLALRLRAGYSFKQRQFYFNIPATFNYNAKHNGYLQVEFGNGNRINSTTVARRILDMTKDQDSLFSIPWSHLTEFKDNYLRITNHWMFVKRFGFEIGLISHHRDAVTPEFYKNYNYPTSYRSVAPTIGLEWHPIGMRGPVVKVDYERSIKGFLQSNISYERLEWDIQSILYASKRRTFSLRVGSGFYTLKGDHWNFVDYTNFRDNNIPGGWNDDWSGEFEMLPSSWYNSSDYYFRTNATYEAPMFFAAHLPWAGRFIEKERIYVNTLFVEHLYPYTEWGYGFTTRLFSMGIFAAFQNMEFNGVGCRFGFELFRKW